MHRLKEREDSHPTLTHRQPGREAVAAGAGAAAGGDEGGHERAECATCRRRQKKAVMVQSEDDEYLCQECFRKEFYVPTNEEGAVVEAINVASMDDKALLFPYLESLMKTDKIKSKFYKKARLNTISKRPVVCPYAQCRRHVGVLSFDGHFKYEHTEVPVVATHADSRTSVHFYAEDAAPGRSHCLLLLNLVDAAAVADIGRPPSFATDYSGRSTANNTVSFVLLATRVAALQLSDDDDVDGEEAEDAPNVLTDPRDPLAHPDDRIFVWLASNVGTDFSYTVAASTLDNGTRVKYYGPVPALPAAPCPPDEGDDPAEMCECGRGLVLADFQYRGMTEGGRRPLVLDVVVHPPED